MKTNNEDSADARGAAVRDAMAHEEVGDPANGDACTKAFERGRKFEREAAGRADAVLSLPEDGAYIIKFDDASAEDEFIAMGGARDVAFERFGQISGNWNAHLFVKIASNYPGNECPSAKFVPRHPPAEPAARAQVAVDAYGVHDIDGLSGWIKVPHAVVHYRDEVLVAHCTHRDSAERVAAALNGQPNMVMPLDEAIRVGNAMLANAHPSPAHAADAASLRALIADDGWAISFQSLAQYRTALLERCGSMLSRREAIERAGDDTTKLARLIGVTYPSGCIAFTPEQLTEFARRLAGGDHA